MKLSSVCTLLALISCATATAAPKPAPKSKTKHVIFVMTDGLRWQEVFNGADESLMNKENGAVSDPAALKAAYWRPTPEARREALMPFVWSVIGTQGQMFGNREKGSDVYVTNGLNFSYPGYNETLCGFPDPRIKSNDKVENPNVTVLEWLNRKPQFAGSVAAFAAWDVFPFIFNEKRAGFLVNAGYDALTAIPVTPRVDLLNRMKSDGPKVWADEAFDAFPYYSALEYMEVKRPKILYLSLGETDDWAHAGNYAQYLDSAHRVDAYLRTLWEKLQSISEYRNNTTLIFSPDHGRGSGPVEWKSHGEKIPESKYIWMGFLGPDTRPFGEREKTPPMTQSQIAATLAAFLGQDYDAAVTQAGKPILDVLAH